MTWPVVLLILGLSAILASLIAYQWTLRQRWREEENRRWWAAFQQTSARVAEPPPSELTVDLANPLTTPFEHPDRP